MGGRRTLGSLSAVIAVDQLHGYAFVIFAPEIARSLHVSTNGLATIGLARGLGFAAVGATAATLIRRGRARRVTRYGASVRTGALVIGGVAMSATVAGGLAVYGATGASGANAHRRLLPAGDHEAHRMAGRLGNAAVAMAIGMLAYVLPWRDVFVALAVVAGVAALTTLGASATDYGEDDVDGAVLRVAAIPGGRVALGAIVASGLVEFPMYVVVFHHLGAALHVSVLGRALLIAAAELAGVAANRVLGQRLNDAQARSPQSLGAALVGSVGIGFGLVVVAMVVSTPLYAVVALCAGAVATSVTVPLLALGTRAVLADAVPRRVSFVTTAAIAAVLLGGPADDALAVALLAVLPVVAAMSVAAVTLRSPVAMAAALEDVANVTPDERMLPTPGAFNEA